MLTSDERTEFVILIDDQDQQIGTAEKLAAHRAGQLHRAFSVMIWDAHGRLLLQQRHIGKYHSGGLWTNTCCGHPRPDEEVAAAAARRLNEEMGFTADLSRVGQFRYRADLDQGLTEHELVHIFAGQHSGPIRPDPAECDGYTWMHPDDIRAAVRDRPESFTAWFGKYIAADWPIARTS